MTDITLEQRALALVNRICQMLEDDGSKEAFNACVREAEETLRLSAGADWIPAAKYPDDGNGDDDSYNAGWNACRSAMIAAAPRHEPGESE